METLTDIVNAGVEKANFKLNELLNLATINGTHVSVSVNGTNTSIQGVENLLDRPKRWVQTGKHFLVMIKLSLNNLFYVILPYVVSISSVENIIFGEFRKLA